MGRGEGCQHGAEGLLYGPRAPRLTDERRRIERQVQLDQVEQRLFTQRCEEARDALLDDNNDRILIELLHDVPPGQEVAEQKLLEEVVWPLTDKIWESDRLSEEQTRLCLLLLHRCQQHPELLDERSALNYYAEGGIMSAALERVVNQIDGQTVELPWLCYGQISGSGALRHLVDDRRRPLCGVPAEPTLGPPWSTLAPDLTCEDCAARAEEGQRRAPRPLDAAEQIDVIWNRFGRHHLTAALDEHCGEGELTSVPLEQIADEAEALVREALVPRLRRAGCPDLADLLMRSS